MTLARTTLAACIVFLCGCRSSVNWAVRVPKEGRECTRDCEGAPDDPVWRECIAACGGEVSEGECDGTYFHPKSPKGCRDVETTRPNVLGTIILVGLLVVGGGVLLGSAARKP